MKVEHDDALAAATALGLALREVISRAEQLGRELAAPVLAAHGDALDASRVDPEARRDELLEVRAEDQGGVRPRELPGQARRGR